MVSSLIPPVTKTAPLKTKDETQALFFFFFSLCFGLLIFEKLVILYWGIAN